MLKPECLTFDLSKDGQAFLSSKLQDFPAEMRLGNEAKSADWVEERLNSAETVLPRIIEEFRSASTLGATALHITGLRLASALPPTPEAYAPPTQADVWDFDLPHLALASLVGKVYGSRHVRGGRILADIFPKVGYDIKANSAFGSKEEFDFHADGVVQPDTAPDVFALHCLRNREQVPTFFSSPKREDFSSQTYNALCEPVFTTRYELDNEKDILRSSPVLEEQADGTLHIRYYGAAKVTSEIKGKDANVYDQALDELANVLRATAQSITLQPGEMLFVNNKTALHGRRAFQSDPSNPQERRWLRRVFIAQDDTLQQRVKDTSDRILISDYKR